MAHPLAYLPLSPYPLPGRIAANVAYERHPVARPLQRTTFYCSRRRRPTLRRLSFSARRQQLGALVGLCSKETLAQAAYGRLLRPTLTAVWDQPHSTISFATEQVAVGATSCQTPASAEPPRESGSLVLATKVPPSRVVVVYTERIVFLLRGPQGLFRGRETCLWLDGAAGAAKDQPKPESFEGLPSSVEEPNGLLCIEIETQNATGGGRGKSGIKSGGGGAKVDSGNRTKRPRKVR